MVDYPYLPKGRSFKFVPLSNKWMMIAKTECDTKSGCSAWPSAAIIVKENTLIGASHNQAKVVIPCPRYEQKCKTGEGYELCREKCGVGEESHHSEYNAVKNAKQKGNDTEEADLYLFGHWWACEHCWNTMIDAGIADVFLLKNAHSVFTREKRNQLMEELSKHANPSALTSQDIAWQI